VVEMTSNRSFASAIAISFIEAVEDEVRLSSHDDCGAIVHHSRLRG
jgi:hypothetical protein